MHTLDCSPLPRLTTVSRHSLLGAAVGPMPRGLFVRCNTEVRINGVCRPPRNLFALENTVVACLPPASITHLYLT